MKLILTAIAALTLFAAERESFQGRPLPTSESYSSSLTQRPRVRTLFQQDFARRTISLATGQYGTAVQDSAVVNLDSELDFGNFVADQFAAGVQGGQTGKIRNIGTSAELAKEFGYQETVGGGQGFSSIRFEGDQLVILADLSSTAVQPFADGQAFFDTPPVPQSFNPKQVEIGHIYLVHIVDENNADFRRFAKLLVTAHEPNVSVTFAWEELQR